MKPALVISGGGSRGAFAVGAVRALRERGVEFGLVAGTSTGALMAPLVAIDELDALVRVYTSVRTADILAPVSLQTAWRRGYLFDSRPLEKLAGKHITTERAERVLAGPVPIFVSAVSLQTGQLTYFQAGGAPGRCEGSAELRPIRDRAGLLAAIVASANQPVFMPPVCITPDEEPIREYVDGGIREYAPISIAVDNGAEEIYVILHSPALAARAAREGPAQGLGLVAARALGLLIEEVGDADLKLAQLYSEATIYLETIRQNASGLGLSAEQVARLFEGRNPLAGRRPVRLHVIRPEREFPGYGLEFHPPLMKEWLAWGARRAQEVVA